DRRPARGTGGQGHLDLDGRVAPGIEDLAPHDLDDLAHVRSSSGVGACCWCGACCGRRNVPQAGARPMDKAGNRRLRGLDGPTESARSAGVGLNPFAPGFFANPYEQYAQLREHAPVYESPFGPWILTRYDDCVRLLRDSRTSVEERRGFHPRALVFCEAHPRRTRGPTPVLHLHPPHHPPSPPPAQQTCSPPPLPPPS